jgi:hypothetical protein
MFSIIVLLSSCLNTTDTTTVSSNPCFTSLTFASNDSIPYISTAVFTLEFDKELNDSVIVNLDSLPYQTRVDSVNPTFAFKSSAGAKLYFSADYKYKKDSAVITGTDTIDFRNLVRVKNWASDGLKTKTYPIKVNVHKVEPQLYVWNKMSEDIDSHDATNQKAIVINDIIFYYLNNGTNAYLYKSTTGQVWAEDQLTNFPTATSLTDMQLFNGKVFVTGNGDKIYSSSNQKDWTVKVNPDYLFKSLLFSFDGKLWAVVQSKVDSSYRIASSTDGDVWIVKGELPAGFPVRDFAPITYSSRNGKSKVLVLGGYAADNTLLKSSWSSEDGTYWVNLSQENKTLDTLDAGASVISYDKKLFVFGRRLDNGKVHLKRSIDEGLSWQTPDTLYNRLRQVVITKVSDTEKDTAITDLQSRIYQSVVVLKPHTYNSADSKDINLQSNNIFIIGGKTNSGALSDVWKGKLNRKNFLLQ